MKFARKVEQDGDKIRIERQTQEGYNVVEAPLPEGGQWFERLIEAPGDVSKVLLVP